MQLFVDTNINFLKYRYHFVVLSLIIIGIGVAGFFANGINLGIDFAGGANVIVQFAQDPPIETLRSIVAGASIQRYGPADDNAVLIRLPQQETEGDYAGQIVSRLHESLNEGKGSGIDLNYQGTEVIAGLLANDDPDKRGSGIEAREHYVEVGQAIIDHRSELGLFTDFTQVFEAPEVSPSSFSTLKEKTYLGTFNVLSQETVGPQIGKELQKKAFWAVILSTLAMGVYIAVRFDLKFAIAAIICLFHDVAGALTFVTVTKAEFEILTIAALLMIIGYSINDTVVVYDRVRENMRKMRGKADLGEVMNLSINQTLSRTILTSSSVMIILTCLIVWGGQVINEFAWLLLIGTVLGTYSSVSIVPAIALAWNKYIAKDPMASRSSAARESANGAKKAVNGAR